MAQQKYAPNRLDAGLTVSGDLPASATTAGTSSIDLGHNNAGGAPRGELEITVPTMTTGQLPDADTAIFKFQDSADDSAWADLETGHQALVLTGASSAGDAGETVRPMQIPSTCRRYLRLACTTSASVDVSALSMSMTVFPV